MAVSGDTGNGATLTFAANMGFGTTTTAMLCTHIEPGGFSRGGVEASDLGTVGIEESIPTDLAKPKTGKAKYKFLTKPTTAQASIVDPTAAGVGSIVITWPIRTGETTAANYTGTGFITDHSLPTFENGMLQEGEIEWQYDGDTGPTVTAGS